MKHSEALKLKVFEGRTLGSLSRSSATAMLIFIAHFCIVASGCSSSINSAPQRGLQGVVFDQVSERTALAAAGIQPGDVLVSWSRKDRVTGALARGDVRTGFDWLWLKEEQAPRGPVSLEVSTEGKSRHIEVEGRWAGDVRPQMSPKLAQTYAKGISLIKEGNFDQGVTLLGEIIAKVERHTDRSLLSWLYIKIGRSWIQAKNFSAALNAFRSALAAAPDDLSKEACWSALGETYRITEEFKKAEDAYRSGLSIRGASQHSLWVATLLSNVATMALYQQDLETVIDFGERALRIRQELAPRSFAVLQSLTTMGGFYLNKGDLKLAESLYEKALKIQQEVVPDRLMTAGLLSNLGLVAWSQNDLRKSEDFLRRSLAIRQELTPLSEDTADSLHNLGNVAYSGGQLEAAQEYRIRALAIQEQLEPDSIKAAHILTGLGNVAADRHHTEEAMRYFERAVDIYDRRAPNSISLSSTFQSIGAAYRRAGNINASIKYFEKALAIREKFSRYSADIVMVLNNLGGAYRELGQLDIAMQYYVRGIEVLESQTESQEDAADYSSATLRNRYWVLYRDAVELLLLQGKAEEAFNVLERGRARSFSHLLAERDYVRAGEIPEEVEGERKTLAAKHEAIRYQLSGLQLPEDADSWSRLSVELKQINLSYQKVVERIREIAPRSASFSFPKPYNLRQVQHSLDPGTLLLSFSVGKDHGEVFAVTSEGLIRVTRISVGYDELSAQLDVLRPLISRSPSVLENREHRTEMIKGLANLLYRELLEPVGDLIERSTRLLIIPDVPLHALPWGSLVQTGDKGIYLAEWRPYHIAPSSTVYGELTGELQVSARAGNRDSFSVVVFGDPRYPETLSQAEPGEFTVADPGIAEAVERGARFSPLPATRFEAENIGKMFPGNAKVFVGFDATEENAKNIPRDTSVIHFAAHAFVDESFPLDSAIALTIPEVFAEGRENGLLHAWEIMEDMRIDADLVVLSACDTGLGEELGAEGLIGLTRAFQYAGARSTIASLWSVDDGLTAELMINFYSHFRAGVTKDEALQRAQIEFIRRSITSDTEPDAADPYYWAAFQLSGDWK